MLATHFTSPPSYLISVIVQELMPEEVGTVGKVLQEGCGLTAIEDSAQASIYGYGVWAMPLGQTEEETATEMAISIWQGVTGPRPIKIRMFLLDDAPYSDHSFGQNEYLLWLKEKQEAN